MSVDVAEGAAVTFDNYETEDGSRRSEYGKYIVQNGKEVGHKHIIKYNDGITSEHVIASASVPVNYDYTTLEVESLRASRLRRSEYGKYIVQNGKEVGHKHIIKYNDGITSEHVIASASVPVNYDYTTLEVESLRASRLD